MPAKTTPARQATVRKKPAARRKPVPRARVGKGLKVPKSVPVHARFAMWLALKAAKELEAHKSTVMSRKDAAILRMTHEGCPTCKGNGQIFTKGKDGSFTGSKPCPAKPTHAKAVYRVKVAMAARFGADKNTGLIGWTCPCGTKTKPRFRDAKEATKDLRTHERNKHGGKTVGGAWYGQGADTEATIAPVKPQARAPRPAPARSRKASQPTAEEGIMSDASGLDFSDPTTPIPTGEYAWSATLTLGPAKAGSVPAKDRTGSYTPPPGATVGQLLDGLRRLHAKECGIPIEDVVLVRYSLREK